MKRVREDGKGTVQSHDAVTELSDSDSHTERLITQAPPVNEAKISIPISLSLCLLFKACSER